MGHMVLNHMVLNHNITILYILIIEKEISGTRTFQVHSFIIIIQVYLSFLFPHL